MKNPLGDYIKHFERIETSRRLPQDKPIYVRIDGKNFSSFCRTTLDERFEFYYPLHAAMIEVTRKLVAEFKPVIAYTQSDEISLIFYNERPESEHPFGGKVQKLCSVLAGFASAHFRDAFFTKDRIACFDARAFSLDSKEDAARAIYWRFEDCFRNAVQMAARRYFPQSVLHGRGINDMLIMMKSLSHDFEHEYGAAAKYGTFVRRESVLKHLTPAELNKIPEDKRPDGPVWRNEIRTFNIDLRTLVDGF